MLLLHQMLSTLVFYFIAAAIDASPLWLDVIFRRVSEVYKNYFWLDVNIVCKHRNRVGPVSEIDTKDKNYVIISVRQLWFGFVLPTIIAP